MTWRHPRQRAKWELAAAILRGFRATLDALGFTEVATPKLVESATESGANVFEVDYFGRPAYLAQSPQFYKQQLVGVFERVYEVGPVFRAEPHDTVRHLAEYVSPRRRARLHRGPPRRDRVLRDVVAGMVGGRRTSTPVTPSSGWRVDVPVVPDEIPVLHFREALAIVGAPDDEPDLAPEHERALGEWALAEHGSDFVAVEGYPTAQAAVLHATRDARGPALVQHRFDLSSAGSSWSRGGAAAAPARRLRAHAPGARRGPGAPYAAYLEAFRHGMPPHGGFAIGLERWVGRLVEAANIREVTLFPRDLHRLTPVTALAPRRQASGSLVDGVGVGADHRVGGGVGRVKTSSSRVSVFVADRRGSSA